MPQYPAPVSVDWAKERYTVTVRRREEKATLGLRFAEWKVVEVLRSGLVAEWSDHCVADVAVLPGDAILRVNGVHGEVARQQLRNGAALPLEMRRAQAEQVPHGHVEGQPPEAAVAETLPRSSERQPPE